MHGWRHPKPPQHPIKPARETDVAMAEHRRRIQYHPEDHHCGRHRTGYDNSLKPDAQGQRDLDGAEPRSRRDIEIQIAKMPAKPLKRIGMS